MRPPLLFLELMPSCYLLRYMRVLRVMIRRLHTTCIHMMKGVGASRPQPPQPPQVVRQGALQAHRGSPGRANATSPSRRRAMTRAGLRNSGELAAISG